MGCSISTHVVENHSSQINEGEIESNATTENEEPPSRTSPPSCETVRDDGIRAIQAAKNQPKAQQEINPDTNNTRPATPKRCCGRSCELHSSSLCCEHMSFTYTSPQKYCKTCKERYIEATEKEVEMVLTEDEQESEEKETTENYIICKPCSSDSEGESTEHRSNDDSESSDSETGPISQDNCPVCLHPFTFSSGALYVLPCQHAVCHSHRHKLDSCPLCRHSIHELESKSQEEEETSTSTWAEEELEQLEYGECGTQSGRYSVMHRDSRPRRNQTALLKAERERVLRRSSCSGGYEKSSAGSLFSDASTTTLDLPVEEDERRHSWTGMETAPLAD